MRFRVLINSTLPQKACCHISRFFREPLIPYNIICIRNSLFIIIGFLHKFIHHRNKHVKVNVFPLIPDFSILTNQADFKQVSALIQHNLNFSGMLESVDPEFKTTCYYFHCLNLNSPGHKDGEIGFQDGPDILSQFQIVVLISLHDSLFFRS